MSPSMGGRVGRPTKLTPKVAAKLFFLAKRGCTDDQMAALLNVGSSTIREWRLRSDFRDQLNRCKSAADDLVEMSLFELAIGYEFTEEAVINGQVVEVKRRLPPNHHSCTVWLKNRRREQWRDRTELEHLGQAASIQVNIVDGLKQVLVRDRTPIPPATPGHAAR